MKQVNPWCVCWFRLTWPLLSSHTRESRAEWTLSHALSLRYEPQEQFRYFQSEPSTHTAQTTEKKKLERARCSGGIVHHGKVPANVGGQSVYELQAGWGGSSRRLPRWHLHRPGAFFPSEWDVTNVSCCSSLLFHAFFFFPPSFLREVKRSKRITSFPREKQLPGVVD